MAANKTHSFQNQKLTPHKCINVAKAEERTGREPCSNPDGISYSRKLKGLSF